MRRKGLDKYDMKHIETYIIFFFFFFVCGKITPIGLASPQQSAILRLLMTNVSTLSMYTLRSTVYDSTVKDLAAVWRYLFPFSHYRLINVDCSMISTLIDIIFGDWIELFMAKGPNSKTVKDIYLTKKKKKKKRPWHWRMYHVKNF